VHRLRHFTPVRFLACQRWWCWWYPSARLFVFHCSFCFNWHYYLFSVFVCWLLLWWWNKDYM